MKKLLVLALVLAMAGVANATIIIQAGGVDDPPETEVTILVDETIYIGLYAQETRGQGQRLLGVLIGDETHTGAGTVDLSQAILDYAGEGSFIEMIDDPTGLFTGQIVNTSLTDTVTPIVDPLGQLVSKIVFTATAAGDVVLQYISSVEGDDMIMDSQVIHIIPEPMTIGLLGLGGLLLRRRK